MIKPSDDVCIDSRNPMPNKSFANGVAIRTSIDRLSTRDMERFSAKENI